MADKRSSVIATLSDQLRRDISLGLIHPGDKLNIEALKRQFKISHPSVREALSLLVGEGYVEFEDQKGFRVSEMSLEGQQDIIRVRAELECLAFEWSVKKADMDWRAQIVATHHTLSEVETKTNDDPIAFSLDWDERNRNFHLAIVGNCGSPKLLEIIRIQYDMSRRYRLMAYSQKYTSNNRAAWVEQSKREHIALKEAALNNDVALGKEIIRNHITKAAFDTFTGLVSDLER